MNKEDTIKNMDLAIHDLRNITVLLKYIGKYSDYVYQAKFDQRISRIDDIIDEILKDELNDVR